MKLQLINLQNRECINICKLAKVLQKLDSNYSRFLAYLIRNPNIVYVNHVRRIYLRNLSQNSKLHNFGDKGDPNP